MPNGRYTLHDPHDGTPLGEERFQCAPGPAGWRYVAKSYRPDGTVLGTTDLTLDARHRPIRVELRSGGWQVRGGALDGVHWVRAATDPADATADATEGTDRAHAFTGDSPAFLIATARLLDLDPGSSARIRLVSFTGQALAPRTLDQSWQLLTVEDHPTDSGPLPVEHYRVTDLDTGELRDIHLTGDVLLAAPGIELEELDSPPNPRRRSPA